MYKELCPVLENKKVAPGHYVLKLKTASIAKKAQPGQFVQIHCSQDSFDPLLPRPFSFLDVDKDVISILYHVVGKGTGILSHLDKGKSISILGPLGNGFAISSERVILVGGGVGIPPLYHLAKTAIKEKKIDKKNIIVMLGARNKSLLLCEKEFKALGIDLRLATDDGSKGKKGFVTSLLTSLLRTPSLPVRQVGSQLRTSVYTCGPTVMMKSVALISSEFNVPCQVSVEVPMACGFGACLGCAIKVRSSESGVRSEQHRFAIACCEGPVFKGTEIVWE